MTAKVPKTVNLEGQRRVTLECIVCVLERPGVKGEEILYIRLP